MSNHLQGVAARTVQVISGDEILGQINVLCFKVTSHHMRRALFDRQGKDFCAGLKVAKGMCGMQFEVNPEMSRRLGLIGVGPQRNGEIRLQVLDADGFVILEFQSLGSVGGYRNDARAENGAALGFFRSTFTHLQQAGIDGLLL